MPSDMRMTIWRLVIREILHRKLNFILGLLSVMVASACLVGTLTLLHKHDINTAEIIAKEEAQTSKKMRELEDDYRKIMKKLGFNLFILPRGQNLSDFYADDYSSKYMPEDYVTKLSESNILLVRHLLPILQQKLKWNERQRTIILIGTRGEVPILHRNPKKPILDPVPPGSMVVGYELHRSLNLSVSDRVKLLGKEFTVSKCYPERGNKDDITIWINLKTAQEMLEKRGKINGIMALQCFCTGNQLANIRSEISGILPDVQVIEFATKIIVRAEARYRAAVAAKETIEEEKKNRARLRSEMESFAAVLVPFIIIASALWIGFLMVSNVRERNSEIGILRALGMRTRQIFIIFLSKAILIGFLGSLFGYLFGIIIGAVWQETPVLAKTIQQLFDPGLLFLVLVLFPVLSVIASWIPAVMAVRKDPIVVLREE